jgi:hypothetical protein
MGNSCVTAAGASAAALLWPGTAATVWLDPSTPATAAPPVPKERFFKKDLLDLPSLTPRISFQKIVCD